MITGSNPCYPQGMPIYEEPISCSVEPNSTHPTFLYNLSILKDRVHQVLSLASIFMAPDHTQPPKSTAAAMGTLIQEIIVTASSMMFACQQMSMGPPSTTGNSNNNIAILQHNQENKVLDSSASQAQPSNTQHAFYANHHQDTLDQWYSDNYNNLESTNNVGIVDNEDSVKEMPTKLQMNEGSRGLSIASYDIIELDASDLLAKYTHYCQVCGKGFKRDANLRMHMRAHGDEYKSSAALSNPMKNINPKANGENMSDILPTKYSCPQEGCRWNKKHAKFQPLKSMICVKNHYKRSHCPKMYVCKRCNTKQFSVLSDLRTHEKHCGDLKWQCSCGTTFSRKDKLMGHVALFVGHTPVITSLTRMGESR